jgi:hypothetical protein
MNDEEMIFTESKLHKRHVYRGDTQKMLDDMFYSHMYVWSDTFNILYSLVVCSRAHDLFVFACVFWCPTHIVLCFSLSCVPYDACFSGLFILDCPLGIL